MKCVVEHCRNACNRTLCTAHRAAWFASPEVKRTRGSPQVALVDFVRRIEAEHRNGGNGA